MRKAHLFMGLAILLWGTSAAIGQEKFGFTQCNPCTPLIDPCGGDTGLFSPFTFGGWIEAGAYTNSHGNRNNGPMHYGGHNRTDFQMHHLYFFGEKEMNTKRGFDWGGRVDLAYGTDYGVMQTLDGTFDDGWGTNKHGYGMAAYQLYGTLGFKNLSVTAGKFITPIGWEAVAAKDNIFYSHSYCYMIEPITHTGIFATYDVSNRLSLNTGWTTGMDSSFKNPNDNSALLSGLTYSLTDKATVYYWINAGKQYGYDNALRNDYFVQSLCLEWALTKRFTYVFQYDLRNDNYVQAGGGKERINVYSFNNHFLYRLTDKLTAGTRVEWCRDNGGYFVEDTSSDYWQVTLGLRWDATKNLSFRPEVRYDWCKGATPFAGGTRSDQISGGGGVVISF